MTKSDPDSGSGGCGCLVLALVMFSLGYCARGSENREAVEPAATSDYDAPSSPDYFVAAPIAASPGSEEEGAYYPNCASARSAGAAPVYSGDAGYGAHLDRDGDGVGCE